MNSIEKLATRILDKLTHHGIMVYALVGESGSGKSFRAKLLAQQYSIQAIIDDGLLIQNDKILAGKSAKLEKTYMGAVRTALFDDKASRDQVARILQRSHIKSILILGTSDKMVNRIALRLQLPPPAKIIRIEDISTREEIEKAIRSRQIEGKHVIPVPASEVKKKYSQIFLESVRVHFRKELKTTITNDEKLFEKSIVTPEFSKRTRIDISEAALCHSVFECVKHSDPDIRVKKLIIKTDAHGYKLSITIDVPAGSSLTDRIQNLQKSVIDNIERDTSILIEEVGIIIDQVVTSPEQKQKLQA
jgi:adenylate kinase family enzyme/uncharacterized alkaline shock family protein YloU